MLPVVVQPRFSQQHILTTRTDKQDPTFEDFAPRSVDRYEKDPRKATRTEKQYRGVRRNPLYVLHSCDLLASFSRLARSIPCLDFFEDDGKTATIQQINYLKSK